MTVSDIKLIVLDAVTAKEKSDSESFAAILQEHIESFLFKVEAVMGISIDNLPDDSKKVPSEIEKMAIELRECHSL